MTETILATWWNVEATGSFFEKRLKYGDEVILDGVKIGNIAGVQINETTKKAYYIVRLCMLPEEACKYLDSVKEEFNVLETAQAYANCKYG